MVFANSSRPPDYRITYKRWAAQPFAYILQGSNKLRSCSQCLYQPLIHSLIHSFIHIMAAYAYKSMLVLAAAAALASAQTYKATITEYGSGDVNGSGNCNVKTYVCSHSTPDRLPILMPIPRTFTHTRIELRAVSTPNLAIVRQCPRTCTASVRVRVPDPLVGGAGESPVKRSVELSHNGYLLA